MDPEMEIENAKLMLSRVDTVHDLVRFWTVFKARHPHIHPALEEVEGSWSEGLQLY